MIPGEYFLEADAIEASAGRDTQALLVRHTGDRPIQVGSHYHFYEVNEALSFDRDQAYGMRLDIAAGTGIRFEPGEEKQVKLVAYGGARRVFGHQGKVGGPL
jgi:urease beta subunit